MTDERQPTQPKEPGAEPIMIPVPTREDVLRDLEKVAKPKPSQRESSPEE